MSDLPAAGRARSFRRRRERSKLVCHQCHRRKLKCDKGQPCDRCSKTDPPLTCTYDRSATDSGEKRPPPEAQAARSDCRDLVGPNDMPVSLEGHEDVIGLESPHISPAACGVSTTSETSVGRRERDQNRPEITLLTPQETVNGESVEQPPIPRKVSRNPLKRSWYGRSSIHCLLEELEHILIPLSQAGVIKPDGKFTSYSDLKDQLFQRRFLVSGDSDEAQRSIFEEIPDREIAIKLVDRYFKTYGSIFRFLNQSNFQAETQRHWELPESVSLTFCIHLLLVIAIGNASIQPTGDRIPLTKITTWWHLIQAWQSVALRSDPCDIATLQSSCLISLMRQCYGLEVMASWPSSGALVRTAMMAGLHRDPSFTGYHLDAEDLVLHQNLWYTIVELDLQSSMDQGMQPTLTSDDWDMPLPTTASEHLETPADSQAIPAVFVLTSTLPVRIQIAHFLNNIKSSTNYNEAFILHEQLSPAAQLLLSSDAAHRSTSAAFTHGLPAILCARSLLALHIPFGSLRSPLYTFSHNISISTAMSLMERLDPPQDKNGWTENDALVTLMRTSSSMFQTIGFPAILFICVQMESYFADPQSWTLVPELKERFAKILGRYIYIAEQRLPTQDFVGKAYMIPAMVLAHMRLANSGMSREDMIANDAIIAEEVTTTCFNIFRNRPDLPSE